jgi:lipoate-protein ligase A
VDSSSNPKEARRLDSHSTGESTTLDPIATELARDFLSLDEVEAGGPAAFRTWRCETVAIVMGRSQTADREVHGATCAAEAVMIHRRASGGGAVVVGPGTLQYALAVPFEAHPSLRDIGQAKLLWNEILIGALPQHLELETEPSGDLLHNDRKVSGLALRRRRRGLLIHGTILETADLSQIARLLQHPSREPDYRNQRSHLDFLANIGRLEVQQLERNVNAALRRKGITE